MILATAETSITIIAASIPVLRALIQHGRPSETPANFCQVSHEVDAQVSQTHSDGHLISQSSRAAQGRKDSQLSSSLSSPDYYNTRKQSTPDIGNSWLKPPSELEQDEQSEHIT
jgi:hypothetical protein